ncbi:MAG: PLP-dependent aminotransferase family protein [Candidatus Promineifilaceae bacterium]
MSEINGQRELRTAGWTHNMQRSLLREMLAVCARPGIRSFAGGLPAEELFPAEALAAATARVLQEDGRALNYGPPYLPLKRHIVALMAERGVTCSEEQIFLTTGAQQALNVLARLFLEDGGQVMLEEIVYTGMQQVVCPYQPQVLSVPTDLGSGIVIERVEEHLAGGARPAFLYVIPEAHNPLGVSIDLDGRRRLVELAGQYGLPIIEDDAYGLLRYDGRPLPPLRALDGEQVFYVGSFSKILAPALRLGWLVAPERLLFKLTVIKEALDLESSALTQRVVATLLDDGFLAGHVERLRREYGRRRDVMLAALERHFPAETRWSRPTGGMFIWVELPAWADTAALLTLAVEEGVAFIPGVAFTPPFPAAAASGRNPRHCLRLNFSACAPEVIEEGIGRLGRLLKSKAAGERPALARPLAAGEITGG